MKKKILLSLLVVLSLFLVVGCGSKKTESKDSTSNKGNDVVDNNKENEADDIKLYSDDTKIVFDSGEGKIVFYYEGDKITAHHVYINYGSASLAQTAYASVKLEEEEGIKKAYVKGSYLVVEYEDSEFENLTLDDVKTAYSYLEQVQKNN